MSPLPEVEVTIGDSPVQRVAPPSTGNLFLAGLAERGPANEPTLITSKAALVASFGERDVASPVYDVVDVFFREEGSFAYFSRLVGPDPTLATVEVVDQTAGGANALRADAASPGAWGADLDVVVTVDGANFSIEIELDDEVVQSSGLLATNAEAVAAFADSPYVRFTDLGGAEPADGTYSLVGGTDDRNNVTAAERQAALAAFTADYGPGQVALPGFTTEAAHQELLAHAHAFKRIPLLDAEDTDDASTLIAAATALRPVDGHRLAGMFAPWDVCPGESVGTTRTVPPCARNAALHARSLASGAGVGDPAAGGRLPAQYVDGLSQPAFSDADRELLNDAGVNVSRIVRGEVLTYGNRTLASALTEPNWAQLSQSRVIAAIAAEGSVIGERYVHAKVDGRRINVGKLVGELQALCLGYFQRGDLYGDSPADAFTVTPATTIEESTASIIATVEARVSPGADRVEIAITKTPTA